jgi:hypothetical protein
MIAVADDGTGLRPPPGTGRLRYAPRHRAKAQLHGSALDGNRVYLVTVNEVFVADRAADGSFRRPEADYRALPDGGQHPNRTMDGIAKQKSCGASITALTGWATTNRARD